MTAKKDSSTDKRENIFEILDGVIFQLGKTKKMFMIMIFTVLIIPPVALVIMTFTLDLPFQEQFEQRLQEKLDSGIFTQEEYQDFKSKFGEGRIHTFLHLPYLVILIISFVWLGIGVRQWIVLSKWDKKYQSFKAKQEDVDKKLDDDSDDG